MPGSQAGVAALLTDLDGLQRWWPAVVRRARNVRPGDAQGVGASAELGTCGWLPIPLRWRLEITEADQPVGYSFAADGDVAGHGIWTLEQRGRDVVVAFDGRFRLERPGLRTAAVLLSPLAAWEARRALAAGEQSLRLELERQAAQTAYGRALVPPPPARVSGPSRRPVVIMAAAGLLMVLVEWLRRRGQPWQIRQAAG